MGIFSKPDDERRERWETLRGRVELGLKNFRTTAANLKEIRDQELYKFSYATFEECCSKEWKITARYAANLIDFEAFCEQIGTVVPKPDSERQFRALKTLPAEERVAAWTEAQADGGTPRAIARVVARRRPKKKNGSLKPLPLKVPLGRVLITPNRKATDYLPLARAAVKMLEDLEAAQREAA